jgi:PiT family inorganic phosphate transporter
VVWAAVFNFLAFAFFDNKVAHTIGAGIVSPRWSTTPSSSVPGRRDQLEPADLVVGLPSSSSHALVGGLVGAAFTKGGFGVLGWSKLLTTAAFIVVSPLVGLSPRAH